MFRDQTPILLTQQLHDAKRAGRHFDIRLVKDGIAYSWATRKQMPNIGETISIFQQPDHSADYALRSYIVVPKGNYGEGVTKLQFVRKAIAHNKENFKGKFTLTVPSTGERYLFRKVPSYGDKTWILKGLPPKVTSETSETIEKIEMTINNRYLTKAAKMNGQYTLRDHQMSAVETAIKRNGNILLSHPVGSGKTGSSVAVFEALKEKGEANRALIVTPAGLRTNFGEGGVKKFTDGDYRIYGNKQENASDQTGMFTEPKSDGPDYGIVSYEMFREDPEKYIKGHNADTVIFDEIHRIKNDSSKTFAALKSSRGSFKNFIGMTGSITSNTPADVVPLIDAMTEGKHNLGSKTSFENRFVSIDRDGNKVVNNPILVRSLIAPYVHNVTEEQLEEGLGLKKPVKDVHEILIPLEGKHEDLYRYAIDQLDPITKMKLAHGLGKISKAEMDKIFSKLLKSRQVANSMATLDKAMTLEESADQSVKVKRLLDDVQDHLTNVPDAQIVIHSELINGGIDVLEAGLKKRGIGYGTFIGKGNMGVNEKSRQKDVVDYNSGAKKVLLISAAGGEGLDLPNTTMVASLDGHWNPEKINQVEARGVRLGGLSHRAEKDRRVIVNRYITQLPISKLDALEQTQRLLNPMEALGRALKGEQVFYNPLKRTPTVDQIMYNIAASKAKGNEQLKGLFEKTSAFSFKSDRGILNDYMDKYQDQLLTGDFKDKWIDESSENKYVQKLRDYYKSAKQRDTVNIAPKEYDDYKNRTRVSHALKNFGSSALSGAVLTTGLGIGPILKEYAYSPKSGLMMGGLMAGAGGLILGALAAKNGDKPHTTTSSASAGKMLKLKDEDLLKILRGESVQTQQVKTTDHYIKFK